MSFAVATTKTGCVFSCIQVRIVENIRERAREIKPSRTRAATTARTVHAAIGECLMPIPVIRRALLAVFQHIIRFASDFEFLLRIGIAVVAIGVMVLCGTPAL